MKKLFSKFALVYLRFLARFALALHKPTIIGIAGSVGKSSTRNSIEAILKDHFPTKSVGNSETGIPLGILGMKPTNYSLKDWGQMLLKAPLGLNYLKGTKYLIAEMGIDDPYPPKNMTYLLTILRPHIAVSLNVSATHTMQFEKLLKEKRYRSIDKDKQIDFLIEKIAEEDTKIITQSGCQIGIYNADDYNITKQLTEHMNTIPGKLLSFGEKGITDITFGTYNADLKGSMFQLFLKSGGHPHKQEIRLTFPNHLLPKEYREVFAAAILTGLQTGLEPKQIITTLQKNLVLPKGRASLFKGIADSIIIDSSYNASKSATLAFLQMLKKLKAESKRPVVFIFGDMRELGSSARVEHEAVAEAMVNVVDYLYLVGSLTREYVLPVIQQHEKHFKEVRWYDSSVRVGEYLKDNLPKKSLILAKGSQNTIFLEEAVKMMLADKKDAKNLCRQDAYWIYQKKKLS